MAVRLLNRVLEKDALRNVGPSRCKYVLLDKTPSSVQSSQPLRSPGARTIVAP